jgi:dihydropteroate synthase
MIYKIDKKSDSTLMGMNKATLIGYIRVLEHNYEVVQELNEQQIINFKKLLDDERERIVSELTVSGCTMATEKPPHKYFKAVGLHRAIDIVRGNGVSTW